MKLLFVNACVRGEKSRTKILCDDYIAKFLQKKKDEDWTVEEVNLNELNLEAQNEVYISERDELIGKRDFAHPMFDLANQLIEADHILIGAPYWDFSFPAMLKIYLERCSVTGLTFIYDDKGIPAPQCKAESLVYLTTSGAPIGENNLGYDYVKALTTGLFGIKKTYFASAECLDIIGVDVEKALSEAKDKITDIIEAI